MVITHGATAGQVLTVADHPNADHLWICTVQLADHTLRIVFGGQRRIQPNEIVPVAPPGARTDTGRRVRARRYRGVRSEGMLCSLDELGWARGGPDEVPALRGVAPGQPLTVRGG